MKISTLNLPKKFFKEIESYFVYPGDKDGFDKEKMFIRTEDYERIKEKLETRTAV